MKASFRPVKPLPRPHHRDLQAPRHGEYRLLGAAGCREIQDHADLHHFSCQPGQAKKNWAEFIADPEWKKVAADSEKDGKILAKSPIPMFMDPTDFRS